MYSVETLAQWQSTEKDFNKDLSGIVGTKDK